MTPNPDLIQAVQSAVESSKAHFWHCPGTTLICCVLELEGGFTVLGQSSCLDKSQFHPEVGQKQAFDDAVAELVKFESYRQGTQGPRIELARPGLFTGMSGHG